MTAAPERRRSLRLELVATLVVLLMMAVVSLSLATELLGRRRHDAQQARQLEEHAAAMGALVSARLGAAGASSLDRADVEQVLRSSVGTLGIESIVLMRLKGPRPQPLATAGISVDLPPPDPDAPTASARAEEVGERLVVDRFLRTFGQGSDTALVLRVVASPAPWTRVQDWQEILVLALGVGVVLLVLGIGLLELQVLRPLGHVRSATTRIAAGDLDARAPVEGPAELQSLATDFNTMAGALRERVTQIQAQREKLARAEQLASVGRLSAGIAHEVGNPLAAILGYVELLLDPRSEPPLAEEQRGLLERSRDQIQRIQSIVHQLLDYARPSQQATTPISVVSAAQQLAALLRHDPRCEDVELVIEGDASLQALADPGLLDQILQNLIVNAARAARQAEPPHRVRVLARDVPLEADDDSIDVIDGERPTSKIVIDIQDSGPGVDPEIRPRLFEPFFTTAVAGEGTGLGLAICQGLAQNIGGSLECRADDAFEPLAGAASPGAVFRVNLRPT